MVYPVEEPNEIYKEEVYANIYKEIVKRIGKTTISTMTRMGEEDFSQYTPQEAINRLVIPITGLFGKRLMRGILADALTPLYDEDHIYEVINELLT